MSGHKHEWALLRIDELEREHDCLADEIARLRQPAPSAPASMPVPEHDQCDCKTCRDHGIVVRETLISIGIALFIVAVIIVAGASYQH